MTKREYCEKHPATAYYSGFGGLEIHGIEYGINNHIYCVSGAWTSKKNYHRLKIHHNKNGSFFKLHGYVCSLADCIKMGSTSC